MHHNPPEVHTSILQQFPLEGAVAGADSNLETEPDSGAEDLPAIDKPTMPASDSATESDSGAEELVTTVKRPDLNSSSIHVSNYHWLDFFLPT